MTETVVKTLKEALMPDEREAPHPWNLRMVKSEDCLSYVVWNQESSEILLIDPKKDDSQTYLSLLHQLKDMNCLGVIDTHTHADHVSYAAELSKILQVPLYMHQLSFSQQVHLRVSLKTTVSTRAGKLEFIPTPGHTPDSLCMVWGPFVFTGDTVLFNDVGRDDLPGGDPLKHYESLNTLKELLSDDLLVLPGHDFRGGRVSSWRTQLKTNSSLTQSKDDFIREAAAFDAPPPALFKKSLFENMK